MDDKMLREPTIFHMVNSTNRTKGVGLRSVNVKWKEDIRITMQVFASTWRGGLLYPNQRSGTAWLRKPHANNTSFIVLQTAKIWTFWRLNNYILTSLFSSGSCGLGKKCWIREVSMAGLAVWTDTLALALALWYFAHFLLATVTKSHAGILKFE